MWKLEDRRTQLIAMAAGGVAMLAVGIFCWEVARRAAYQQEPTFVVQTTRDVPAQTELLPSDLKQVFIPRAYLQPGAVQDSKQAVGMLSATRLPAGSQVTRTGLLAPDAHGGIAGRLPLGKRAVTIAVDEVGSVAGFVKPGNFVDCLLTLDFGSENSSQFTTFTLLSEVPVLAVDQEVHIPQPRQRKTSESDVAAVSARHLVTVAVSPEEAQQIVLAQESGRVHLALRPQEETGAPAIDAMTLDRLTRMRGMVRARARPSYMEYHGR